MALRRIVLFDERAIDRVGSVHHVLPGEALEGLPAAFLAHRARRFGILEHSRDGRRKLLAVTIADEQPVAAVADQGGYRAASAPDDGLPEQPGLQVDEAEGFDAGGMHEDRALPVPAPLLLFPDVGPGDHP